MRDDDVDFSSLPRPVREAFVDRFGAWTDSLRSAGRLQGVGRLEPGGHIVKLPSWHADPDRSHVRANEPACETTGPLAIGLHVIEASDDDEAVELARTCPILDLGGSVEVREVRAALRPARA